MTALTLAHADHLTALLPLAEAFHAEMGYGSDRAHLEGAFAPLLAGSPHGNVYLIGPARAPIGYLALSFGWSIEFGGLEAYLDEIYIRPAVRGRGIGSEVLGHLPRALAKEAGLKALSLEVRRDDAAARAFYEKARFTAREDYIFMSWTG